MSDEAPTDGADTATFNHQVIEEFRRTGGRGSLGPVRFENLVLLTTTGRLSGLPRTVPLGFVRDPDGNLVLFASNMGAPRDPDWLRNIVAGSRATVEITGASWETSALVLDGAARDAAYALWVGSNPHVADHQDRAGRRIPMVVVPPPPPG